MQTLRRTEKPLIEPDRDWEKGSDLIVVDAIADEQAGELLIYYFARFHGRPHANILCLARSTDGYTWTKPDCGDGTNIVMRSAGNESCWQSNNWGEFMPVTVLKDERDSNPAQRWKLLAWDRPDPSMPSGICLATSADGRAWKPRFSRPVITGMNDAMSMIDAPPDARTPFGGAFFLYQQTWKYNPRLSTVRDNLKGCHRRISIWINHAFGGHWIGPVTILEPDGEDEPDVQFYWLTPFKRTGGGYGGLLNCHHTNDQTMDVQLVGSHDGWTWMRENGRKPLLEPGVRGRFDCGSVIATAKPVLWRSRVLLFYRGQATVHDGQPRYAGAPSTGTIGVGLAEFDACLIKR